MKWDILKELPGVAEVLLFSEDGNAYTWLDEVGVVMGGTRRQVSMQILSASSRKGVERLGASVGFLRAGSGRLAFRSDMHQMAAAVAGFAHAVDSGIYVGPGAPRTVVAYDVICALRLAVEKRDWPKLKEAAATSGNDHYTRLILMLMRSREILGQPAVRNWLRAFMAKHEVAFTSLAKYLVWRDGALTLASAVGLAPAYAVVDRIDREPRLQNWERKHFILTCGSQLRASDILAARLSAAGHRARIAPLNAYAARWFPSPRMVRVLRSLTRLDDRRAKNIVVESLRECSRQVG